MFYVGIVHNVWSTSGIAANQPNKKAVEAADRPNIKDGPQGLI